MKEKKKGKQLIGLLICLVIGGAALGIGIGRGIFDGFGDALGNVRFNEATILKLIVMIFLVLAGDDGTRVGMKHLENIWLKTFFGCNLDSEIYSLLGGKNLTSVEIYTLEAKYVIGAGEVKIESAK